VISQEGVRYLHFLHQVDDGEAQALAMAEQRALPLLTDDIAGTMLAGRMGVEVVSTLDLLHVWAMGCDAPASALHASACDSVAAMLRRKIIDSRRGMPSNLPRPSQVRRQADDAGLIRRRG
jgi:hypothetical protein